MKTTSYSTRKPIQFALTVFAFIACTMASYAQGDIATPKGVFQFNEMVIDYGTIQKDSDGNRSFSFTNVGDAPIVITDVKASCGCTVPTKPKGPIMPGESAQIGVKYKTSKVGAFTKIITVISNADAPRTTLKIKGVVVDATAKLGE